MVALSANLLRGRFGERSAAFEALVILFHFPPCLVDRFDLAGGERQITRHQVQNALTAIFVVEDLTMYQESKLHAFQVDRLGASRLKVKLI